MLNYARGFITALHQSGTQSRKQIYTEPGWRISPESSILEIAVGLNDKLNVQQLMRKCSLASLSQTAEIVSSTQTGSAASGFVLAGPAEGPRRAMHTDCMARFQAVKLNERYIVHLAERPTRWRSDVLY